MGLRDGFHKLLASGSVDRGEVLRGLPTRRPAAALLIDGAVAGGVVGAVVVALGALVSGRVAGSAALGVVLALAGLSVGPVLMAVTRTASPPAVMAIALAGYAITVLLLALVYSLLGTVSSLSGDHVGYGLIVAAAASSAGQIRAASRLRVLAFDSGTEGEAERSDVG